MARWLIRSSIILLISFFLSYVPVCFTEQSLTVIFTILGIMFSLGLSQIMSFSFADIPNEKFVQRFRPQLHSIQITFIVLFAISTVLFLLKDYQYQFEWKIIKFDTYILFSVYLIFCLIYFIENFVSMHHLKENIEDEVRRFKEDSELMN